MFIVHINSIQRIKEEVRRPYCWRVYFQCLISLKTLYRGVRGLRQKERKKQRKIWVKCQIYAESKRKKLKFWLRKFMKRRKSAEKWKFHTPAYNKYTLTGLNDGWMISNKWDMMSKIRVRGLRLDAIRGVTSLRRVVTRLLVLLSLVDTCKTNKSNSCNVVIV